MLQREEEGVPAGPRSRMTARQRGDTVAGCAQLGPSLSGVVGFRLVPVVIVRALACTRYDLLSAPTWVGLENFRYIFTWPVFGNSLLVTVIFTALAIPATIALGLLLAIAINRGLPGTNALRVLYVLPWVCAPLALGVGCEMLFSPTPGAEREVLLQRAE